MVIGSYKSASVESGNFARASRMPCAAVGNVKQKISLHLCVICLAVETRSGLNAEKYCQAANGLNLIHDNDIFRTLTVGYCKDSSEMLVFQRE